MVLMVMETRHSGDGGHERFCMLCILSKPALTRLSFQRPSHPNELLRLELHAPVALARSSKAAVVGLVLSLLLACLSAL